MLDDDNFETFRMHAKGGVFVMFSQPWCKPCQAKKAEFLKAARLANVKTYTPGRMETGGVPFAAVNCEANSQLCRAVNVKGYPSFAYFTVESGLHKVCEGNPQQGFYNNEFYYSGHHPFLGEHRAEQFVHFVKTRRNNQWFPVDAADFVNKPLWGSEKTGYAESGNVLFIDDYHWSWFRRTQQRFLAMFYKPRARPFRKARPEYAAASVELNALWPDTGKGQLGGGEEDDDQEGVKLVAVNCEGGGRQTCAEFGVSKFPQFKFFNRTEDLRDNVPMEWTFQEGRKKSAFVQFAKHMSKPWKNQPEWHLPTNNHANANAKSDKDLRSPSGNVQFISDYDFTAFRKKFVGGFLAFFYAPWCAASRAAQFAVTKLSEDPFLVEHGVPVAAVDCTYTNSTCRMTGMETFPAFRWIQGNDIQHFAASRSVAGLRRFVQRKVLGEDAAEKLFGTSFGDVRARPDGWSADAGVGEVNFLSDENFDDWAAEEGGRFISMFYAPWCAHCQRAMTMFARASHYATLNFVAVDAHTSRMLNERYSIKEYPTFLLFDDARGRTDDPVNLDHDFVEMTEAEDMIDWLRANGFFTSDKFSSNLGGEGGGGGGGGSGGGGGMVGRGGRSSSDGGGGGGGGASGMMGQPGQIPSGAAGHVLRHVWSPGDKVLFMGDSYFATYKDNVDQFIAFFYAPWCGHCKRAKPEISAASVRSPLAFVAVDCTDTDAIAAKNLCQAEGIQSYPTIKYFEKGKGSFKYAGPRTAAALVEYASMMQEEYQTTGSAAEKARGW